MSELERPWDAGMMITGLAMILKSGLTLIFSGCSGDYENGADVGIENSRKALG
jgi:hypothetical protein